MFRAQGEIEREGYCWERARWDGRRGEGRQGSGAARASAQKGVGRVSRCWERVLALSICTCICIHVMMSVRRSVGCEGENLCKTLVMMRGKSTMMRRVRPVLDVFR